MNILRFLFDIFRALYSVPFALFLYRILPASALDFFRLANEALVWKLDDLMSKPWDRDNIHSIAPSLYLLLHRRILNGIKNNDFRIARMISGNRVGTLFNLYKMALENGKSGLFRALPRSLYSHQQEEIFPLVIQNLHKPVAKAMLRKIHWKLNPTDHTLCIPIAKIEEIFNLKPRHSRSLQRALIRPILNSKLYHLIDRDTWSISLLKGLNYFECKKLLSLYPQGIENLSISSLRAIIETNPNTISPLLKQRRDDLHQIAKEDLRTTYSKIILKKSGIDLSMKGTFLNGEV